MTSEETDILQMSNDFYSMFRNNHVKSTEKRKKDKSPRSKPIKIKSRVSMESMALQRCTRIDFLGNSSYFSAYANVRQYVLEYNFANACHKLLISYDDADNENELAVEPLTSPVSLPKIIGIGIETVFELVQESHATHPELCVKALEALLNILEGQQPQSLRKDSSLILDSVFNVLLKLSNCESPEKAGCSKSTILTRQLSSVATSCLISLSIARGDTKSLLETILTLFKCDKSYISQELKNPDILKSLQLSTQAILVGRPSLPQWLTNGIPSNAVVDSFGVTFPEDPPGSVFNAKALASDGIFLYLHCSRGLYKIGSGSFGTLKGHIYAKNENFHNLEKCWIGWANGKLYYTVVNSTTQMRVLNTETLQTEIVYDYSVDPQPYYEEVGYTFFTDGELLGYIMPAVEEGFLVRTMLKDLFDPSQFSNEFNIRLVRKSIEACGPGPWDTETDLRQIETGFDDDISTITSGKEFTLLKTCSGRLLYCGKGASLGQKVGANKQSKWLELPLTRAPKFIQCAIGHEGIHSILLAEDGTAFFVGTPKRGEDGDLGKPRRVVKASKPKKVSRMDGHSVSFVACNNGTSAFVTRSGELYMFGKDTAHCDSNGLVSSLRGVAITHIAMGKAHSIIKTADGQVYAMGMNNKGQCGRSQPHCREEEVADEDDVEWDEVGVVNGGIGGPAPQEGLCPPGGHRWRHDQCMVCTVCRECTGYGSACISALRPDRNPGQECGCGVGDAGCEECGTCRSCVREGLDDADFLVLNGQRAVANPIYPDMIAVEERPPEIPRPPVPVDPLGLLELNREEAPERRPAKPIAAAASAVNTKSVKTRPKETASTEFSAPTRLILEDPYITQIACGLYHSVFLSSKDKVFVCGSNTMGQLGLGDTSARQTPVKIPFPAETKIIKIAAGSYHTVCLDHEGVVYTAGAHAKNQLGRSKPTVDIYTCWHASMLPIENLGSHFGRRVTWIGASSDNTFIRLEASLISPNLLRRSTVTANKTAIVIVPPPFNSPFSSIIINRRDGNCAPLEGENSWPVATSAICLDPLYNFLWTYEWKGHKMSCYNVVASAIRSPEIESNTLLAKHPYAIPTAKSSKVQRWQTGINLLACVDTLVSARSQNMSVNPDEPAVAPNLTKTFSRDDYSSVCRFDSLGGGWGYSNQSVEAIRFCADADIILGGFGLYGGRGEYTAQLKVFDIGVQGGEVESEGDPLTQAEEIQYESGPRQKYRAMFEEPVSLVAGRWYVAWVHITGPSSDCGSNGQMTVVSDDQITFHFKSSRKSNNGTDVNAGQIPELLYRSVNSEQCNAMGFSARQLLEPIHILTADFLSTFNPGSVHLLTSLIGWCRIQITRTVQADPSPENEARFNVLKYISCSCLRLIEHSTNQAYPLKGCGRPGHMENLSMAEAIGDARVMLQNMITTDIVCEDDNIFAGVVSIVQQGCDSFVNCFQVFYPTSYLKWECLKSIIHLVREKNGYVYLRLLSVVLCALCGCRGQLLSIFPVLTSHPHEISDETSLTFVTNKEGGKLKPPTNNRLLVSQMMSRFEADNIFTRKDWDFWQTLKYLLQIMEECESKHNELEKAVVYNSSVLVGKLMEELVSHACGTYGELETVIGQIIVSTPSRFTRTNQSRTWNTGNGSPDAVGFFVDQEGVSVFGACVYSGTGVYDYELDLLQDVEETTECFDQPGQKWLPLESARGSFDSDDCVGDIAEIRFPRAVHIKAGIKYALRLKNHGGRTCNGDGGVSVLRCPDGTTFTFSACPLSHNGTNQIRGQIPYILYFRNPDDSDARQKAKIVAEMEARKSALVLCKSIFQDAKIRLEHPSKLTTAAMMDHSDSTFVTILLPSILAHLPQLATSDPRSSVELLELIREILPAISSINNALLEESRKEKTDKRVDSNWGIHYAWVESPHPYKPASLSHYKVAFPEPVQRMTVEFDPRCMTAQNEDSVRILIPFGDDPAQYGSEEVDGIPYIPVMDVYSGAYGWPQSALVLPGNELMFSLETASDYVRADKSQYFGFRCLVSGYEWKETTGLGRLELELSYLGGLCTNQLIVRDMLLPPVAAEELQITDEMEEAEDRILDICNRHHNLFSKGIGLEYFPTVQEALEGIVPLREKSKEREFIADFISRTPNSGGERLANWLQPDSFVDPAKCEVVVPAEKLRRGKTTVLIFHTRDQHGDKVVATNLQVEMKAIPVRARCTAHSASKPSSSARNKICHSTNSFEEIMMLQVPYQVTVKDKMRYHSISMMKEYENYSFEELRLMSPTSRRNSESILVRHNYNGTYSATWSPACAGIYNISLSVDGYSIPQACTVEVEEPPEGTFSLSKKSDEADPNRPPSKKRMFKAKSTESSGLRVRAHPTLQSEQLGQIPVNGVIDFLSEVHNDDGIWVKLNQESYHKYCQNTNIFQREGWCLQFNQHLGKTFLFPLDAPKPIPGIQGDTVRKTLDSPFPNADNSSSKALRLNGSTEYYKVVKCGAAGHNVRTRPCLRSPPVGIMAVGAKFRSVDQYQNCEGVWLKLDPESRKRFGLIKEGEGWTLACSAGADGPYIQRFGASPDDKVEPGFDFSVASQVPQNVFQSVAPPAAFGSGDGLFQLNENTATNSKLPDAESKLPIFRKAEEDSSGREAGDEHDIKMTSSVTLLETSASDLPGQGPAKSSPIDCPKRAASDAGDESPKSSPRSRSSSTFGALQKWLLMSTENLTSHASGHSSSKHSSSVLQASESLVKKGFNALSSSSKTTTPATASSATQTSPVQDIPANTPAVVPKEIHFSIGSSGAGTTYQGLGEGTSNLTTVPQLGKSHRGERRHRSGPRSRATRQEQSKSPRPTSPRICPVTPRSPLKEAIGPGQAQSLRAVFGAILWHAGIIHDAMAFASYLRFLSPGDPTNKSQRSKGPLSCYTNVNWDRKMPRSLARLLKKDSTSVEMNDNSKSSPQAQILPDGTRLRSKKDASKQNLSQRHSVEVTSSPWLQQNTNPRRNLEELEFLSHLKRSNESDGDGEATPKIPKTASSELSPDNLELNRSEEPPVAVSALQMIWYHVKSTCSESLLHDVAAFATAIDGSMKPSTVKSRKERKVSRGQSESRGQGNKVEKPVEIQRLGRSFLLEPDEEAIFVDVTQQCELCHVRFNSSGKSRKVFFGFSSLCANCSDSQLKLKKQQSAHAATSSKAASDTPVELKSVGPTTSQPHSVVLKNALFLLQMINTTSDGQLPVRSEDQGFPPIIAVGKHFSCYGALGVTQSQVDQDVDVGPEALSSDVNFLQTDDMSAEDRLALDNILSTPIALGDLEEFTVGDTVIPPQVLPRRRKTSNGDHPLEEGSEFTLLNRPSPALQKFLDASKETTTADALEKLCGGVFSFVREKHELEALKLYLFQTIRRITCRSYGMQMLAWLMRNVSSPDALHDLFWWYASTLEPRMDNDQKKYEGLDNGWWQLRVHPLCEQPSSIFPLLAESFYMLLQTMSDIMPHLPIGSPVLEMAVKCWGVAFTRKDHRFLHKCKIFRHLSHIMSQFDGDLEWSKTSISVDAGDNETDGSHEFSTVLEDLTSTVEVKVSSRLALIPSLTDESTETFWESGDEDRNRTKNITIVNTSEATIKVVGVYTDNIRDNQHKVSFISVKVGSRPEEFVKFGSQDLDPRSTGWTWFPVEWMSEPIRMIRIDCKGPDNSLRIRQVKVLGVTAEPTESNERSYMSSIIARRKCENETLRVFRLLSSEVFGKLLSQLKRGDDDEGNDLQEHVVGILFSRNKLTHLQKQVCCHIVSAIHREAMKIKFDFETHAVGSVLEATNENVRLVTGDKPKVADRYCFEMLSLVLALAGSKVGRSYLSQQSNLIYDLIQLLHVGTPRIQRQVTLVLRKILCEIKPEEFGKIVRCYEPKDKQMTPRLGILDLLLGVIAKALSVKARSTNSSGRSRTAKQICINDAFNLDELPYWYWFLHGEVEANLASTIVKLIKDMAEGVFSKEWETVTKKAIADAIMYLPTIDVAKRNIESCLGSPEFWLSISALCVLHRDHSDELSYPNFSNGFLGRPWCNNHDDGETVAVIQCSTCGDLCNDCDRILHLPKSKWSHVRNVCKEEEESIGVELHEGCGRIKLFWLMALADSSTLKTLVEFRNGIPKGSENSVTPLQTVGHCRFCNKSGNTGPLALGNICGDAECQEFGRTACERILPCGHLCGGVKDEKKCLPCLHTCPDASGKNDLKQDGEDMCMICFTDALAFAPAIKLECDHVFHYHCCRTILERRWAGPRITFAFSWCPICKAEIVNEHLQDILEPIHELYVDVQRKSLMRLEYEGLSQSEAIVSPGGRFFRDPGSFAMDRYAYYLCYKCKKAYFGGDARCGVEIQLEFDPQELVCGGCSDVTQAQLCPKHGTDYLEYKCRYCCSVAVFFCFGTTHFCNGCHDDFQRITTIPKQQLPHCPAGPRSKQLELEECPLHVSHPPTGEEFALGCGVCRNAHTF